MAKNKIPKNPVECLERPVISEKATGAEAERVYTFWVKPWANKVMVKQAIKKLYNFWPAKVHIINVKGKNIRYGRNQGRTKAKKKALVFLKPEEKIDFHKL